MEIAGIHGGIDGGSSLPSGKARCQVIRHLVGIQ